jgi:hypothetical protein
MVYLEFERPSTWSIGRKVGALAVILLVLGPFLPYWVRDYNPGGTAFVLYAEVFTFGLLFLIPLLSALLIFLLLYFKFGVYIEEDGEQKKINHFILMIWGPLFFVIYLADAIRASSYSTGFYEQYAGFGLWMIILGYFLCTLAGYLEWKKPHTTGPQILFGRSKNAEVENTDIIPRAHDPEAVVPSGNPSPNPSTNSGQNPAKSARNNVTIDGNPTNAEETTLLRWSEHVSGNGRTFELCMNCHKYSFITTKETEISIIFQCSECKTSFNLKK